MLPKVPYMQKRQEPQIVEYKGVNYRPDPKDGELASAVNMSSWRFPWFAPRRGRVLTRSMTQPHAAWAGDNLVQVNGTALLLDGQLLGRVAAGPKQFAPINSKLVIWPDRVYIDFAADPPSLKDIDAAVTAEQESTVTGNTITLSGSTVQDDYRTWASFWTTSDGELNQKFYSYDTAVFDPNTGTWATTGGYEWDAYRIARGTQDPDGLVGKYILLRGPGGMGQYWATPINAQTTYTLNGVTRIEEDYSATPSPDGLCLVVKSAEKVETIIPGKGLCESVFLYCKEINQSGASDLARIFGVGDAVKITAGEGGTGVVPDAFILIRGISGNVLTFDDGTFGPGTLKAPVTIARTAPDMEYICSSENRLWGVSNEEEGQVYDRATGKMVTVYNRVIHASSLGDPTNFNCFDGLSTDSYSLAVAEAGNFTGCIGYRGDVLFFKEDKIIRIAGDYPADYAMYVYDVPGASTGSHKSAVIIDDVLYYLSRDGVRAWSGSEDSLISYPLGEGPYLDGVAGTDGIRYFLSARDANDSWKLHVYDTLHRVWSMEDNTHAIDFINWKTALWDGDLQVLTSTGIWRLEADDSTEAVEWSAEFSPADERMHQRKNYRWVRLRMEIPAGSTVTLFVAFDEEDYQQMWTTTPAEDFRGTVNIPLPPNRCDRIRVKMTGAGDMTLRSIIRAYNVGSVSTR